MDEKSSPLPPFSEGKDPLLSSCTFREEKSRTPSNLRFSVAGERLPRSFWRALALAVLAGGAMGLDFGSRAGGLAEAPHGRIAETPQDKAGGAEVARLIDELRSLRAKVEQIRHVAETARTAERLKALETAHEASAAQAQLAASTATRLDAIDARLARLERAGVDATQTASIKGHGSRNERKTPAP